MRRQAWKTCSTSHTFAKSYPQARLLKPSWEKGRRTISEGLWLQAAEPKCDMRRSSRAHSTLPSTALRKYALKCCNTSAHLIFPTAQGYAQWGLEEPGLLGLCLAQCKQPKPSHCYYSHHRHHYSQPRKGLLINTLSRQDCHHHSIPTCTVLPWEFKSLL